MTERVQLRRTKGWRLPPDTVVVARPTRWGNPINWKTYRRLRYSEDGEAWYPAADECRRWAVTDFRAGLLGADGTPPGTIAGSAYPTVSQIRADLAGKNLACWCPSDQSCHADVLLAVARGEVGR